MATFQEFEQKQARLIGFALGGLIWMGTMVESPVAHAANVTAEATSTSVAYAANVIANSSDEMLYQKALAYQQGKGVQRDDKKAIKYLRLAAERGHVESQYTLGILTQDIDRAMFWLSEAASRGHSQADFAYNQLASFDFDVGC